MCRKILSGMIIQKIRQPLIGKMERKYAYRNCSQIKKGYVCSPELPYGEYVVFESTTPENLQTVNPFLVTIDEDSREPQTWRVFDDRPIQFYLVIKKITRQENPVLNNSAYYKIFDVEKSEYVEMKVRYPKPETISVFQTNEEGYLQTPEQLKCGTYRIEEIQAPDSFVKVGEEKKLVKKSSGNSFE